MKFKIVFSLLLLTIFINNVSTFSLMRNAKSKQLSFRACGTHNGNNRDDNKYSNRKIESIQKAILTSLLGFQMLNSFSLSSSPASAATIIKSDMINIDREAIENELKKDSEPIFLFLKKSFDDVKNGIPLPNVLNNVKVAFRNKQFYVDFDMPTIDSLQLPSSFSLDQFSIPPPQLNQKPLLTTTVSSTSTSSITPVKPYWKDIADELNNNLLNDGKMKVTVTELNDSVNSLLPTVQALLHDWRFLIPAGLLIVVLADTLQSLNQYKEIVNDQDDDISELQKRINKEKEEKLLATQLLKEKEAREKELQLLAETERKKKIEIEAQLTAEMNEKKKLEADMKLAHELEIKKRIENEAKSLATKGSRIFTEAMTRVINELSAQESKTTSTSSSSSSLSSLLSFEDLIVGPVKETEAKLVLEIKSKKLSESDTKFLIESVAKELNSLILEEMKVIEKTWQKNQAKREYDIKRKAEEDARKAKIEEMKRLNEIAASKASINNASASNNAAVKVDKPVTPSPPSPSPSQEVNQLISQMIQQVEESVELAEVAEEIAEEEAKLLHEEDLQIRRESKDQNVSEYKAAYEAKRRAEAELRREKVEDAKRREIAASFTHRKVEPVVKPTIISEDEEPVDDSELIAEAEAIMLLEEEALRKLESETANKIKALETPVVTTASVVKKVEPNKAAVVSSSPVISSSSDKKSTIVTKPTIVTEDEEAVDDSELIAEAEAIMLLEEEAMKRIETEATNKIKAIGAVKSNTTAKKNEIAETKLDNAALAASAAAFASAVKSAASPTTLKPVKSAGSATTSTASTPSLTATSTPKKRSTKAKTSSATLTSAPVTLKPSPVVASTSAPVRNTATSSNVTEVVKSLKALTPSQLRRRTRAQLEDDCVVLGINKTAGVNLDELNKESIAVLIENFISSSV